MTTLTKPLVLLRARSGPKVGLGHVVRTSAVAEEIVARDGRAQIVVDDEATAAALRADGFDAHSAVARPPWSAEAAAGAWLDGFVDWTADLRALARRGTATYLVENRTPAREFARFVVQPKLYVDADVWERVHAERILRGAAWIPLRASVRAQALPRERDLDLLVTFGGSDPLRSTERVLALVPRGVRAAVAVGLHMAARRADIERLAARTGAEVLPVNAPLAPWMARARVALTAIGTTLYELFWLRTHALVLANYAADAPVLAARRGPFHPFGIAGELGDRELADALGHALADLRAPAPLVPHLGDGAARLADRLIGREPARLAA